MHSEERSSLSLFVSTNLKVFAPLQNRVGKPLAKGKNKEAKTDAI